MYATTSRRGQQWYDTEHFPKGAVTDGFPTATRLTCIDEWPRYNALYDLADVSVLRDEGYAKISEDNNSRWTLRVVPRTWGLYRTEGVQAYTGNVLIGAKGSIARLVLWRFRNASSKIRAIRALKRQPNEIKVVIQFAEV